MEETTMKLFPPAKKRRWLAWLPAACFFMLNAEASSAQPNFSFQHYTSANGLSADGLDHIVQDKYGFLWIGSANGLNRFDGKNFTVYHYDANDTNSLPNDII